MDVSSFASDILNSLAKAETFRRVALQTEGPVVSGRAHTENEETFLRFYFNEVSATVAFALIAGIWGKNLTQSMDKIKKIKDLAEILKSLRSQGKKIVHCHGVFDLLHIGHIRYFEQAKRMGDVLVVTITEDGYMDKGPLRPAFTEALRTETAVP